MNTNEVNCVDGYVLRVFFLNTIISEEHYNTMNIHIL